MARGQAELSARVEAPVTVKAYLLCVFAAFGGNSANPPHNYTISNSNT